MKKIFFSLLCLIGLHDLLFAQSANLSQAYQQYFLVKEALVKSDPSAAAQAAKDLAQSLESTLAQKEFAADANNKKLLATCLEDAQHISETKEIGHQRDHFMTLSTQLFALMKVYKPQTPVYFQFCPMANKGKGANWVSQQAVVQNPYYGKAMLTCGRVAETLK